MAQEFTLPDVGEGLTEAEIVDWKVAPGDTVTINQVLVEIETAKSLVELPSPYAGTIDALLADEGAMVEVGKPIVRFAGEGGAAPADVAPSVAEAVDVRGSAVPDENAGLPYGGGAAAASAPASSESDGSGAVLVGYGTAAHGGSRRRRSDAGAAAAAPTTVTRPVSVSAASAPIVLAKPPIRKLAKDLDVDLAHVTGSGSGGEVTRDDVLRAAQQASVFRNLQTPDWADEREERVPVKGVRKAIATAMTKSAFEAPHVSVFVDLDATRTMEFVKRLKTSPDFAGIRVSPLLIAAKALIWAVRRNPSVNSTFTEQEIVIHHYVNLGIAAATPRGLVVPNIKDAQSLSLRDLARELENLTTMAREGKTQPADMSGGTITITNLGSFGMDTGTPILNPGEVGILAFGAIKQKPWVVDGEVRPRFVTTLSGSFDHRVVDGDVVSRFIADVASVLEEPALLLD